MRQGRRGCCLDVGAEGFCQMLLQLPHNVSLCPPHLKGDSWSQNNMGNDIGYVTLCVSDRQIAMVLACPYIIYTATDRFLLRNQNAGQSGKRDRNSYTCAHAAKYVKGCRHLVLSARIPYYGHSAEVTSCLYSNILLLMANNIQRLFSVPDVVSIQMQFYLESLNKNGSWFFCFFFF